MPPWASSVQLLVGVGQLLGIVALVLNNWALQKVNAQLLEELRKEFRAHVNDRDIHLTREEIKAIAGRD